MLGLAREKLESNIALIGVNCCFHTSMVPDSVKSARYFAQYSLDEAASNGQRVHNSPVFAQRTRFLQIRHIMARTPNIDTDKLKAQACSP